jgi:hypothetical protein
VGIKRPQLDTLVFEPESVTCVCNVFHVPGSDQDAATMYLDLLSAEFVPRRFEVTFHVKSFLGFW